MARKSVKRETTERELIAPVNVVKLSESERLALFFGLFDWVRRHPSYRRLIPPVVAELNRRKRR